jgi:hypothetical protein
MTLLTHFLSGTLAVAIALALIATVVLLARLFGVKWPLDIVGFLEGVLGINQEGRNSREDVNVDLLSLTDHCTRTPTSRKPLT